MARKDKPAKPAGPPPKEVVVHRCRFVEWMPSAIECLVFCAESSRLALGRANGDIEIYSLRATWHRELVGAARAARPRAAQANPLAHARRHPARS